MRRLYRPRPSPTVEAILFDPEKQEESAAAIARWVGEDECAVWLERTFGRPTGWRVAIPVRDGQAECRPGQYVIRERGAETFRVEAANQFESRYELDVLPGINVREPVDGLDDLPAEAPDHDAIFVLDLGDARYALNAAWLSLDDYVRELRERTPLR